MGYRALLFCPDEKTAHTVTLVLNDLEFAVEVCSEPFAAVKKLMGEHFDGVVVDCDNEQNATLLFKSARQSTSNQAALAVAVVEGQAGVAKAFRIGANLVLTKPINVEQAKGTLRVARGLLRKGEPARALAQAETASAAAASASEPARSLKNSAPSASLHVSTPVPAPSRQSATPPVKANPWGNRVTEPPVPVASSPAQDQELAELDEEEIFCDAESLPPVAATAPQSRAAIPGKTAFSAMKQMAPKASDPLSAGTLSAGASAFGTREASAAAPARIPQAAKTAEPLLSKIARTVGSIDEPTEQHEIEASAVARNPVSNKAFGGDEGETSLDPIVPLAAQSKSPSKSSSTGNTKILLGVLVALLLIAALYLVWTQIHGQIKLGSTISNLLTPATEAKSQPTLSPAQPTSLPAAATAIAKPVLQSVQDAKQPGSNLVSSNSGSDANEGTADIDNDVSAASHIKGSSSPAKASARPLLVKSGKENASKRAASDAAAPSMVLSADNSAGSLPSLIDVSTKSTPVLQTLSLSQGVAQGLIVKKVQPNYPSTALRLHLEGQVQLMATVTKSGNITAVKTVSGEPLLAQAATEAVKQWKYKPYLLNGEPVEIQTQVTINFKLPR